MSISWSEIKQILSKQPNNNQSNNIQFLKPWQLYLNLSWVTNKTTTWQFPLNNKYTDYTQKFQKTTQTFSLLSLSISSSWACCSCFRAIWRSFSVWANLLRMFSFCLSSFSKFRAASFLSRAISPFWFREITFIFILSKESHTAACIDMMIKFFFI